MTSQTYSKTQLDSLLAAKAATNAIPTLAAVATTGAYSDLTGTPAIPTTPAAVGAEPAGTAAAAVAALVGGASAALDTLAEIDTQLAADEGSAAALAALVATKADAASVAATYPTKVDAAGLASDPGLILGPHQLVLARGATGAWDDNAVESLNPFWDSHSGRWAGVYTGYGSAYTDTALRGAVGLAFSDDLVNWTKTGSRVLQATENTGDPDVNGTTGPLIIEENGTYYLFYIGLTATGYESGTKTLNVATNTLPPTSWTPTNWTRHGTIIAAAGSGWRASAVWHPTIVKRSGTYYLFFNAGDNSSVESIGYATATSLLGPWAVDDVNSPLVSRSGSGWDSNIIGDPCVYRTRDGWIMHYFGVNNATGSASNGVATTSDAAFPLGWAKSPLNPILAPGAGSTAFDGKYAHKPIVVQWGGRAYHFYTSVDGNNVRQVGLAISRPRPIPVAVSGASDSATLRSLLSVLTQQGLIVDQTGAVRDSFTRADAATLGTADTGQAWTASGVTWSVTSAKAAAASGGGYATIDAAAPASAIAVTFSGTMPASGQAAGLTFRFVDSTHRYQLDVQGNGGIELDLYNGGATSVAQNTLAGIISGDTVTILDDGTTVTVLRNGASVLTYTGTTFNTATIAGMTNYNAPDTRYDDFRISTR